MSQTMVLPRKVVVAAIIYTARCCTQANPSNTVPSSALGTPTAPAFVADSGSSTGGNVPAGVPLSSPTTSSGQISFRTKTRNGVRGAASAAVCSVLEGVCAQAAAVLCTCVGGRVPRCHPHPRSWQHSKGIPMSVVSPLVH